MNILSDDIYYAVIPSCSLYCNRLYMVQRHKASAFSGPIVLLFMNFQFIILEGVAVLTHSRFKAWNECLLVNRKSNILRLDCQSYITYGTGFESCQILKRVTWERRNSERKELRW